MKTAGIIAEYNPFHNGHQYQIETVRHLTGADFVIVAMGGDFLQRGVPAIADKYPRTRMALLGGADLVLELPAVWATASAEYFLLPEAYSFSEKQASLTRSAMAVKLRKRKRTYAGNCRSSFQKMLRTIRCWFLIT